MTRSNLLTKIKVFALALIANFATLLVTAQQRAADFEVEVSEENGPSASNVFTNPLFLVIGALVIVTILVFVLKGRRR